MTFRRVRLECTRARLTRTHARAFSCTARQIRRSPKFARNSFRVLRAISSVAPEIGKRINPLVIPGIPRRACECKKFYCSKNSSIKVNARDARDRNYAPQIRTSSFSFIIYFIISLFFLLFLLYFIVFELLATQTTRMSK